MSLVNSIMFRSHRSRFDFAQTVEELEKSAVANGWTVPQVLDLQAHYHHEGLEDMRKAAIVYFCNAQSGMEIVADDANKPMLVMMPTGVAVFETNAGEIRIAHMNFGMMRHAFGGTVKSALSRAAESIDAAMAAVRAE